MPEKQAQSKARSAGKAVELLDAVVIYATFASEEEALATARRLIERRLAACVNIIPGTTAVYHWEGKVHEDREVVAVIKTRRTLGEAVVMAVCDGHSYDNPAAIQIGIEGGSRAYIDWLLAQTAP